MKKKNYLVLDFLKVKYHTNWKRKKKKDKDKDKSLYSPHSKYLLLFQIFIIHIIILNLQKKKKITSTLFLESKVPYKQNKKEKK